MGVSWGKGGNTTGPLRFIPSKPFMKNRMAQIWLGILLFAAASIILYNAYDARGKYMPWPVSSIAPW